MDFINYCISNELTKAKIIYEEKTVDINKIIYDTNTSDIQGPYSLFECMCIKNHLDFVKWFIELGTENKHYNDGFISACQYNNFEIVEYLYNNRKEIKLDYQVSFLVSCHLGHIELVKWLYSNQYEQIDIHYDNETPFLYAIEQNHFELCKWLYHISIVNDILIDIHVDNNLPFLYACYNGRLDICEWLYLISNHTINKNIGLNDAILNGNQELIEWLKKIDF
jgi:ankyrin repeat protein